ncbi:MAG: zf-HC2 domain-containing protein, partial [Candidatus Rokuibacteriota bacterium]
MAQNCTDEQRLSAWCAGIAGDVLEERRSELLWRYLRKKVDLSTAAEIEQHLDSCQHCRQALEDERLLEAARSSGKIVVRNCPSADELLRFLERSPSLSPWRRLEIKRHLDRCELCREESAWTERRVLEERPARPLAEGSRWAGWLHSRWAWAAAAGMIAVVIGLIYPTQFDSQRYARYALLPDIPYEAILAEFNAAHPADMPLFRQAAGLISLGDYGEGARVLARLDARHNADPSIQFFQAHVAAREGRWKVATLLCVKTEPADLDGFRCWY